MPDNDVYQEKAWDVETDPANPQPLIYPVCSECGSPYDYRWCWNPMGGGESFAWFRPAPVRGGCKHKAPPAKSTEYVYAG